MAERSGSATLEAERDFLLRSLDDLESEREAGNIDDDTYRSLHDDYTARAAEVIRAIEQGTDPQLPKPPPAPAWMRTVTVAAIVVFACAAGYLLTRAVGNRSPGDTATGNSQTVEDRAVEDPLVGLQEAAAAAPADYDARIEYARALINEDRVAALREYDAAAALDPNQPEPVTYGGWIIGLAAQAAEPGADQELLVERALERFDASIAIDPGYADAYVFRGIIKYNVLGDPAGAVPDFETFLALAPSDHPMRGTVENALGRAVDDSETPNTTGGP